VVTLDDSPPTVGERIRKNNMSKTTSKQATDDITLTIEIPQWRVRNPGTPGQVRVFSGPTRIPYGVDHKQAIALWCAEAIQTALEARGMIGFVEVREVK
jgi:hypothetical protein